MMTRSCFNVPVRIPHLRPSNLRRNGYWAPLGLVSAWPAALGCCIKCVAPAVSSWGQTEHSMDGESAVWGIERGNASDDDDVRKLFEVYSILKSKLLHDPAFEFTNESRQWIHRMVDYNVPKGNLFYALAVIRSYRLLQEDRVLSEQEIFFAYVLGWCSQWLATKFTIIDDIVDNSYTRRGQPCWFRLPQVGMIATSDASLFLAHIFRIMRKHFCEKPYYVQLLDLFNEVEYESAFGERLDATTSSEKDLSKYTPELSRSIALFEGYSFLRLPVACALILAGEPLCDSFEAKDILFEIAVYFQMQNDYSDCYGDPQVTGKIATDIEDGNCNWLIVKALEHASEEEKKILYENFGNADSTSVAIVRQVYASLDLENMCKQYLKQRCEELKKSVEMHPSKVVQVLWAIFTNDGAITPLRSFTLLRPASYCQVLIKNMQG